MIAPDPFKTKDPIDERGMRTFRAIADRLANLNPPIYIERHIAQDERQGRTEFSTLEAHNSTLDGINFRAADPKLLASAFDRVQDKWGNPALTSMKEDPGHWALKTSFAATIGTGWREVWREPEYYVASAAVPAEPGNGNNMFRMRFGTAGAKITFTALHCAVHEIGGQCNIHIDESGFVLGLPQGVALTPDLYGHIINELKWKTDFRDWLSGLMPNETAAKIVREVVRRTGLVFPNAANGYADLDRRVNSIRAPQTPLDLVPTAFKLLRPTGLTFDAYDNDRVKVQVTGTIAGGDRSITLSVGGRW